MKEKARLAENPDKNQQIQLHFEKRHKDFHEALIRIERLTKNLREARVTLAAQSNEIAILTAGQEKWRKICI